MGIEHWHLVTRDEPPVAWKNYYSHHTDAQRTQESDPVTDIHFTGRDDYEWQRGRESIVWHDHPSLDKPYKLPST